MDTITIKASLGSDYTIDECITMPNPDRDEKDDVIIDENNFSDYFFDVRYNQPKEGQCLARFRAKAEFVDGQLKRDVVHVLLSMAKGGDGAYKVMRKLAGASEQDAIRIPLEMGQDLATGMTVDEVCNKPYEYDCEFFFYADPLNVPLDNHWEIIKLLGNQSQYGYITSNINEKIEELDLHTCSEEFPEDNYGKSGSVRQLGGQMGGSPEEMGSGGCCESSVTKSA